MIDSAVVRIALDAMGGDAGCAVVVPAALAMLKNCPYLELILVGDESVITQQLSISDKAFSRDRLSIYHASQQVNMDESPAVALRYKKHSSMRLAIDLVKQGKAQACVSAGNTGALMATARFVLKTLPGIVRPAIIGSVPTVTSKFTRILDLGANVDSKPEHLLQFAIMGSILARAIDGITNPSLGLLNIGQEDIKGNELVKQTSKLLQNNPAINYQGYIEPDEVFTGKLDIVVCDGFVGNVALKASEGISRLIAVYLKQSFQENIFTRLTGLLAMPVLKRLKKRIDPSRYNGASFLGLDGIVIKSHGGANVLGFMRAIEEAMLEAQQKVTSRIRHEVEQSLRLNTGAE